MRLKYGNSFDASVVNVPVASVAIFPKVDEFYPAGGYVAKDATNTVGKKIPAGTPVEVGKVGQVTKMGAAATSPIGVTYEDAIVGENGCTLTIVTKGMMNESLAEATLTAAQKKAIQGVTFVTE